MEVVWFLYASMMIAALAFALGVSAATGVAFGILPAVNATRVSIGESLKAAARSVMGAGSGTFRTRRALVIGQIAIATPLLGGSGLMIRSIANALAIDTGLDAVGVGIAAVNLPASRYDTEARASFARRLHSALEQESAVRRATVASDIPLNSGYSATMVELDEPEYAGREIRVYVHRVSSGYFETLGIPIIRGREFDDSDRAGGPVVVIISNQMAERFWPNADPVGRVVEGATIVGVVGDATYRGLIPNQVSNPNDPDIFAPLAQMPAARLQIAVRGSAAATDLAELIRAEVRRLDPALPVFGLTTMEEIVDAQVASNRTATRLLGAFASIAVVLAVGGLFGVMMYTVGRRKNEIGIRMALGAEPARVMRMFLGQAAGLVALGLLAGLLLAMGTVRFLASQLYQVGTSDLTTYLFAVGAFVSVGLLASAVPAFRATQVDPLISLRSE